MTFARFAAPAAILSTLFAAPVMAQDVAFELVNSSSAALVDFYTSPVDVESWGEDLLGDGMLASGAAGTVTIADGSAQCNYDVAMVFEDGSELTAVIDVCNTPSYEITD